ncbi:FecR domain-containing protein [Chitinophaga sp. GCM10012297]|uniref:FecR domain-containing protein n=1 Tax=Chitinophaga chungangae TaxID=2821488 RepID=A0ABS3YFY4_9BACT|nr:FecR domain-containing protein [Chitinophaga chungangae]MBO9153574.1 FecR domain-containing protein [Chitinophaga chungangae]
MTFSNFTTQDFLQHPDFRKWVLEQDEAAAAFWAGWLRDNPGREKELLDAKEILLALQAHTHTPPEGAEAETWNRIARSMEEGAKVVRMPVAKRRVSAGMWLGYAVVTIGILALAAVWLLKAEEITYETAMGEIRTIELPDHSVIRLNGNSGIRYESGWEKGAPREVYLTGEAFFTVTQQPGAEPFIVHTNDLQIRVLGTSFNVNTRRKATQVVLSNGKVQLVPNDNKNARPITMSPGDMVVYSEATTTMVTKQVEPENYCSWRNKVLEFTDAPIKDVVRALQENMGVTIEPEDAGLGDQTFTGSIPLDDIGIFFKTISRTFDVEIEKTGSNSYRISKHN